MINSLFFEIFNEFGWRCTHTIYVPTKMCYAIFYWLHVLVFAAQNVTADRNSTNSLNGCMNSAQMSKYHAEKLNAAIQNQPPFRWR